MKPLLPALCLAAALAACSGDTVRYPTPAVATEERLRIAYRAVQVAEIALPLYAASEEIFVQGEGGALISSGDLLWADDPSRAMTLALARGLAEITGTRAAPEPWPFEELPDARVEVQVEDLLIGADGQLLLTGQYFVATARGFASDRAGLFRLAQPYDRDGGVAAIARARSAITADLALLIAREGLR
jgi:hypothetical protein